ncbi:hypothetical protein WH47_07260, partial [Habropoda laboriosa]
ACHNRGMSSSLGWPAHGCATELFIPLDYTRCAEPRRTNRRKRPKPRASELRWLSRARIALSGIDARNPAYFARFRDIERTIRRTTPRRPTETKEIRDGIERKSFPCVQFSVAFFPHVVSLHRFPTKGRSGKLISVQATVETAEDIVRTISWRFFWQIFYASVPNINVT